MRWDRRSEEELDQDIREHLEMEIEENLARGMSPEEARYAAMRKFGSIAKVKEDTRGVWTWVWLETLRADAKHAFRRMRRTPGTSALAVASLAVAFVPSLTMFSIMDRIFLTTIPARAPEEIRDISFRDTRPEAIRHHQGVSYAEAQDFARTLPSFSGFAWQQGRGEIGIVNGRTTRLLITLVNQDFFHVLGLPIALGPGFSKTRPGLVISNALWRREFGRRPDVIGRTLMLEGRAFPIDGVAGPELYNTLVGIQGTDAWLPAETSATLLSGDLMTDRSRHWGTLWARLRPGVPEARATAEVRAAARELARQWPETNRGLEGHVYAPMEESAQKGQVFTTIAILFFGILLAVACANVAGVLLAHAEERRQETAIRLALGASRTRLMREWILESLFLSLAAAGLGIATAYGLIRHLPDSVPSIPIEFHFDFTLGTHALLYAAGLVAFSVLSFGIVPAWRASRPDLIASLSRDTAVRIARFRVPVRSLLIIGQVAAAEVLLFSAGWVLDAVHFVEQRDPGFNPKRPVAMAMLVPTTEDGRPRPVDAEAVRERLERIGGVRSAAYGSSVPLLLDGGGPHWPIQLPGGTREIGGSYAGPGFFTTLGMRMLAGRDLQRTDAHGVLVNARLAWLVTPDGRALGRTIRIDGEPAEIVGIFADAGWLSLHEDVQPRAVRLKPARGESDLWFAIETSGNPEAAVSVLRKELAAAQPGAMILTAKTLAQHYDDSLYLERMGTRMFYVLGGLALLLTATGLHGITAALYARRSREFAIRLALGATPRQIVSLVLRGGLGLTLTGIVLGLGVACPLAVLIAANVAGFPAWSATAIGVSAAIVLAAAVAAAAQPAGRVLELQPAETLRRE